MLQNGYIAVSTEGQNRARRALSDRRSVLAQEDVADDLGLLFEAVSVERLFRFDLIGIAAERMPHEEQVEASFRLRLPDVRHLVHEEALAAERFPGEIVGPGSAVRMEIDVAHRRHCGIAGLDRPPFALEQPDP